MKINIKSKSKKSWNEKKLKIIPWIEMNLKNWIETAIGSIEI